MKREIKAGGVAMPVKADDRARAASDCKVLDFKDWLRLPLPTVGAADAGKDGSAREGLVDDLGVLAGQDSQP